MDDSLIGENLLFCSTALEEGGIVYIRPLLAAMNFTRHFLSNPDSLEVGMDLSISQMKKQKL